MPNMLETKLIGLTYIEADAVMHSFAAIEQFRSQGQVASNDIYEKAVSDVCAKLIQAFFPERTR